MIQEKFVCNESFCTYPGEYIAAPLTREEFFEELQQPHEGEASPLVNIMEMPEAYHIEVAAPGLKSGDFHVSIEGNMLTISVLHKDGELTKKIYRQREFNYSCFRRDIALPQNIDVDFSSSSYTDGILFVSLPKSTEHLMNRVARIIVY